MKNWFRFAAAAAENPTVAEIHIIDFIGSWDDDWIGRNWGYDMGVTARSFIEELAALPESVKAIHLHINSPGGDVQAGVNIANALREQQASKGRTVETFIDGIAASIASVIAMAGSKVHIGDNALVMIHNPWSIAIGNAAEMRKTADVLDTVRAQIIATYKWHSSLSDEEIIALLDAETWMDADQAIANGFATDKVEGLKAAASISAKGAASLKVPDQFRARVDALLAKAPTPAPEPPAKTAAAALDVIRECKAGGSPELAEDLVAQGCSIEEVRAKVGEVKTAKAAAAERERQIRAVCTTFNQADLADGYVAGAMTVDAIRNHLAIIKANADRANNIDTSLPVDQGGQPRSNLSVSAIYRERNGLTHKES